MESKRRELTEKKKEYYRKLYFISEVVFIPVYIFYLLAYTGEQYAAPRFIVLILCIYSAFRILSKNFYKRFFNMAEDMLNTRKGQKLANFSVYTMLSLTALVKIILLILLF